MQATAGETFTAEVPVPPGTWDGYGARVEEPVTREVVSPWLTAVLQRYPGARENPDEPTRWTWEVTQIAPSAAGDYVLVWMRSDGSVEAFSPLAVTESVALSVFPPPDLPAVTPDVSEVAALMRTRVVTEGGEEVDQEAFDETTHPTAADGHLCAEIVARTSDWVIPGWPSSREVGALWREMDALEEAVDPNLPHTLVYVQPQPAPFRMTSARLLRPETR